MITKIGPSCNKNYVLNYSFNSAIIEAILVMLEGYHSCEKNAGANEACDKKSYSYLIFQCIRQYQIPADHYFSSQKAVEKWNELTSENINDFPGFKDTFTCEKVKGNPVHYLKYTGSKKTGEPAEAKEGDSPIKFNDVFHYDHIVPVSLIFQTIIDLNDPDYDAVKEILEKMYVCRLLKEEDRKLSRTKGRTMDFRQVIRDLYAPKGIIIKDFHE